MAKISYARKGYKRHNSYRTKLLAAAAAKRLRKEGYNAGVDIITATKTPTPYVVYKKKR